ALDVAARERDEAIRERDDRVQEARERRESEIRAADEFAQREIMVRDRANAELRSTVGTLQAQSKRMAESVTWQAFEGARVRLYRAIGGTRSRRARALGALLRLAGRLILPRGK